MRAARGASPTASWRSPSRTKMRSSTAAAGSDSKAAAGSWSSVLLGDSARRPTLSQRRARRGRRRGGAAAAATRRRRSTPPTSRPWSTLSRRLLSSSRCRWRPSAAASPTRRATGSARTTQPGVVRVRRQTASTGTWCAARLTRSRGRRIRWPASAALLDAAAVLRRVALKELGAFCGGSEAMRELKEQCERPGAADPSVIDCFVYRRSVEATAAAAAAAAAAERATVACIWRRTSTRVCSRSSGRRRQDLEVLDRESEGGSPSRRSASPAPSSSSRRSSWRARREARSRRRASRRDRVARRGPPCPRV